MRLLGFQILDLYWGLAWHLKSVNIKLNARNINIVGLELNQIWIIAKIMNIQRVIILHMDVHHKHTKEDKIYIEKEKVVMQ